MHVDFSHSPIIHFFSFDLMHSKIMNQTIKSTRIVLMDLLCHLLKPLNYDGKVMRIMLYLKIEHGFCISFLLRMNFINQLISFYSMATSQMQICSSWSICTLPTVRYRLSKPVLSLLLFFNWFPASFKWPPAASSDTDCSGYVLLPSLWLCLNFLSKSLSNFLSNTYLLQIPFF